MALGLKNYWIPLALLATTLIVIAGCGSLDAEPTVIPVPTATPVPTQTPVPEIDVTELVVDIDELSYLGIMESDLQCLADGLGAEIFNQLFIDDLIPSDALSIVPTLSDCKIDLDGLIKNADSLIAETVGPDYKGLERLSLTSEQIACMILVTDSKTLESLVAGEMIQISTEPIMEAFASCRISLANLANLAEMAAEPSLEITLDEISDGEPTADVSELLQVALNVPGVPEVVEDDDIGDAVTAADDLPFTEDQMECLTAEIEAEQIIALATGEVDPLNMLSLIGVLSRCDVSSDVLGN